MKKLILVRSGSWKGTGGQISKIGQEQMLKIVPALKEELGNSENYCIVGFSPWRPYRSTLILSESLGKTFDPDSSVIEIKEMKNRDPNHAEITAAVEILRKKAGENEIVIVVFDASGIPYLFAWLDEVPGIANEAERWMKLKQGAFLVYKMT